MRSPHGRVPGFLAPSPLPCLSQGTKPGAWHVAGPPGGGQAPPPPPRPLPHLGAWLGSDCVWVSGGAAGIPAAAPVAPVPVAWGRAAVGRGRPLAERGQLLVAPPLSVTTAVVGGSGDGGYMSEDVPTRPRKSPVRSPEVRRLRERLSAMAATLRSSLKATGTAVAAAAAATSSLRFLRSTCLPLARRGPNHSAAARQHGPPPEPRTATGADTASCGL